MKLRKFPNCGPLTVFQTLNVIVWPAHGLEFDMPDLKQRVYICQPRKVLQNKIQYRLKLLIAYLGWEMKPVA